MLNFDKDRFVKIQGGAVAIAEDVRALMRRLLDDGRSAFSSWGRAAYSF